MQIRNWIQKYIAEPNDFGYSVFFGLLSSLFSFIQFRVPDYENAYSDLREIPLLISLLYIRNPLYIVLMCFLTSISYLGTQIYLPTVLMHILPLIAVWLCHQQLKKKDFDNLILGSSWLLLNLVYYFVFIFPSFVITYYLFNLGNDSFLVSYKFLATSGVYEITATALVTTLYVVQFSIRESLEFTNRNLEAIVKTRTEDLTKLNNELQTLNKELTSTNEEVRSLNENLEKLVLERTKKINEQLNQLSKYAHMNSHEVRAPLARLLGLMSLIKIEENDTQRTELLEKIYISSEELDEIIKNMNHLLEKEISEN